MSLRPATDAQRLFVALWPPAQVAQRLAAVTAALRAQCGGRAVAVVNQHVTLAFLGAVASARMPNVHLALRTAARQREGGGFDLTLDKLTYRRRGGMFWARASHTPHALEVLVHALRQALAALDFAFEARAFVAHVTLLRDARAVSPLPSIEPLAWTANEVTLVRSTLTRDGARYDIIAREPLRAY